MCVYSQPPGASADLGDHGRDVARVGRQQQGVRLLGQLAERLQGSIGWWVEGDGCCGWLDEDTDAVGDGCDGLVARWPGITW